MIEWIVSSCVLILAVILVRTVFRKKLRAWVRYSLWALVLVRLLIPFTIGSSLLSTGNVVEEVKQQPAIQSITDRLTKPNISYEQAYDQAVQDFLQSGQTVTPEQPVPDYTTPNYQPQTPLELHTQQILKKATPAVKLETVLLWVWISGMGITAGCFLFSNFKFQRYLKKNRVALEYDPVKLRIYTCQGLDTPCLFGLFRPAVYLLPGEAAEETVKQHILCHELTHYRHLDHIWSALRCLCLVLHWYNPLVWVAAILSRRDAELACDEATIRKLGEDQRHSYGKTLIEMTCARRPGAGLMNTATTMTGSKAAIKERVMMIAKKQKLSMITLIIVVLITLVAVGCTFTGTRSIEIPKLSEEVMDGCKEAWVDFLDHTPDVNAPREFANLETNKDGIRYYGSFPDEQGIDNHILFIPIHNYDVCVDLDIGGERFTHRSGFVMYLASYDSNIGIYLFDGVAYRPESIPKDALKTASRIHQQYEKSLYGSILRKTNPKSETEAKLQAEAAYTAWSSYRLNGECKLSYGVFDGYSIILYTTGAQAIETKQIGNESFYYHSRFILSGYKDGKFYNIEDLYLQGKFSNESLSRLANLHLIAVGANGNILQINPPPQISTQPNYTEPDETTPPTVEPTPVFTPSLPNMADADFRSINWSELKSMEDTMGENSLLSFFLQPYYDRPEDFPLFSILDQYPEGIKLSNENQFQVMVEASNGSLGASPDYSSYVNKVWIISGVHIRNSIEQYLGITMEQLTSSDMADNNIIYSEKTDSYYCILGENASTQHIYEIWSGYLYKNDAALLLLHERANGTYRSAVMYAKGDQWCFYANRPFLETYPSHPTDPTSAVQTPMVVYQGIRYEFCMEYTLHWLLYDLTEAATVVAENNQNIPTQELHAAQLSAGTKLYSTTDNGLTLYAVRPDGRVYRLERSVEYTPTLENEPLAYFQKLFRDDRWMNLIGIQEFQHPSEFPINYLCATPLPNSAPITQDERKYLEDLWGHKIETEIQRMPADILQEAVQKYLGLNWDQIAADKLPAYNPATNCYYSNYNGAEGLWESFTVTSVTVNNDTIQVVLELADYWINVATLQITEDGYRFISVETK